MEEKNELEKYAQYGVSGVPQIKADEKKYWLGEFRERVVFALTHKQITQPEAIKVVREKLKQKENIDKVIVSTKVSDTIMSKYMDLSHQYQKDYKAIDMQTNNEEIALVLASNKAVNEEKVLLDKIPSLPTKFSNSKNKKLCKLHLQEIQKQAPFFADEFKEITLWDKFIGIKCSACEKEKNKK